MSFFHNSEHSNLGDMDSENVAGNTDYSRQSRHSTHNASQAGSARDVTTNADIDLRRSSSLPLLRGDRVFNGQNSVPRVPQPLTDPRASHPGAFAQVVFNLVPSFSEGPPQMMPRSRPLTIPRHCPEQYSDDGVSSPENASAPSPWRPRPSQIPTPSGTAKRAPKGATTRRRPVQHHDNDLCGWDSEEVDLPSGDSTGNAQSASHSGHDERPETSNGSRHRSRTAQDWADAGIGAAGSGAEGNAKTGTFFIYSPHDERPETPVDSFTTHDLAFIKTSLGIGGCSVSTHEPSEAVSWMEDNWNDPLLTSIRNSGCAGPFAWMLSPRKPALAIFGCYNEPVVVNMAQTLAHSSGFPVVIRPSSDDPALTLLTQDAAPHTNTHIRLNDVRGTNDEGREGAGEGRPERDLVATGDADRGDEEFDDAEPNGRHLTVTAGVNEPNRDGGAQNTGGGDGGGDGGDPSTVDGKWESTLHRTDVKLRLQLSTAHTCRVGIGYTLKFRINGETEIPIDLNDLTRPLSHSEVIALVDLTVINNPRETQIDRSYASIGFVAHREESIIEPRFLNRGFELPGKTYKHGQQRQIQKGFQGSLGCSHLGPSGTATLSYNRHKTTVLEATDDKVMPKCRVDSEPGDEWDEGDKSYSSFNIAYQLQEMPLDGERSESRPLEVKVGMGIRLRPAFQASKIPLPQISFVHRNQILIWVSDPTSKARIRGIMVLMSSYLDNITTEEELSIYEQATIALGQESSNTSPGKSL
ncbi:hypothetical protein MVEN_00896100 [Mycena venus]|uniref:Uncharacterized protein n=1 Tax=Mycena venus TaxID=2733690 RepID=A0A8H6YGU2_9AGAR|nr:hypothetical protein MVEN_00896100 [Mycena venus]